MLFRTLLLAFLCSAGSSLVAGANLGAQGITTAAIRGTVRSTDGSAIDGGRVWIMNTTTGFRAETELRAGRFAFFGLETGGPYTVTVQAQGLLAQPREQIFLRLGEPLELFFTLQPVAFVIDTVRAIALARATAHGGTATTLADSLVHQLPSLNRDLYDFVRLVPQISTNIGFQPGFSGGGVGFRYNNFLINGVSERTVQANATTALAGGKSLPLDAVKEYQVLLAPYDVRYGDFAGALINTVTKAGTNQLHGSAFAYARNDRLARAGPDSVTSYERWQYGFSLGGPIVRDRLHFFVAPELQHFTSLAAGPYVGQPSTTQGALPVDASDLARLDSIMRAHCLVAGSGGAVENSNPLTNIFGRLDLALPRWNSRAVLWNNYAHTEVSRFSRPADGDSFPLTSYQTTPVTRANMIALQLHTALPAMNGGHNELLVSIDARNQETTSLVQQPLIRVMLPSTSGGTVMVNTGTHPSAQENSTASRTIRFVDNLTLPLGSSHVLTLGLSGELFGVKRRGVSGSYGTWTFSSLDSLARGMADRYEVSKDFGGARAAIDGGQYGIYIGNQWLAGEGRSLTVGLRADVLAIKSQAPYNFAVDSVFGRRTDVMPMRQVHWSPRVGFSWALGADGKHQVRGGAGIFTGRPPIAWLHSALTSYGSGIGRLLCGPRPLPLDLGAPPPFDPDYRNAPQACATGLRVTNAQGDVNLIDRRLRMAQTFRLSLAYDRQLAEDVMVTAEALITRNLSDFLFVNLNLAGPQAVGRNGRVLYGTINPQGTAQPKLRWGSGRFEVIDLINTSANHSQQMSMRLEKQFTRGTSATASYTYTRARDVQTPLRTGMRGTVNWSSRSMFGRHEDLSTSASLNDIPHRVIVAGTHRIQWRWPTEISFYYVGESGGPFTYRAGGSGTRGDLNADGSNANDPIYVPLNAADVNEIRFDGGDVPPPEQLERIRTQQLAFERLIERTGCLRRQRGQILERNSCREPWSNTTVLALRQALNAGGRAATIQLDVYNVLNILNRGWGLRRTAVPLLLEHVRQADTDPAQPVFIYKVAAPQWESSESAFQLQLALRYRF